MQKIKTFLQSKENKIILLVSFIALIIHFVVNAFFTYGIFRDELYYLACADHLDWGYVDQPPLSILLLKLSNLIFGDSVFSIRILPAICNALVVFITGIIVKELNGGKTAVTIAVLAVLVTPVYLSIFDFFSMNAFDILFWAILFYILLKIIKTDNQKLWIYFGVILGLGFQNKLSVLFLSFGIFAGLLFTPFRNYYKSKYIWIGLALAFIIYLPHIIWQYANDFPTLEFINNAKTQKNAPLSPITFLTEQFMLTMPTNAIVWLPGLIYFFVSKDSKKYRIFGFAYIIIFIFLALQQAKPYYLSPAYTILFAGGGIALEKLIPGRKLNWLKPVVVTAITVGGLIALPFAMPVLPPETFVEYTKIIGIDPGGEERDAPVKLGQHYADMFGWENVAATVAIAYNKLNAEEKSRCAIFGQNYGQAGAIDYFGKKYGLPKALSSHNNYWLWGIMSYTGEVMIIIGGDEEDYKNEFEQYEVAAVISHPYSRAFENNLPVYICRKSKFTLKEIWKDLRRYI